MHQADDDRDLSDDVNFLSHWRKANETPFLHSPFFVVPKIKDTVRQKRIMTIDVR
jgi:hypothetical protein